MVEHELLNSAPGNGDDNHMTDRVAPHRSEPIFDAEANLAALYGQAPTATAPPTPPDIPPMPVPGAVGVAQLQSKDNFVPSPARAWFLGAGRMSRLPYFFTIVMVWLVQLVAASSLPALLALGIVLGGTWISVTAGIRRLHDRSMTGWWMLLLFVPLVNVGLSLFMHFAQGDPGPNKYGRF